MTIWLTKSFSILLLIIPLASCDTKPKELNSMPARRADIRQNWVIEQSWPSELDSVPDNIKMRMIKTPESFAAFFANSQFATPDSIRVTSYFRKHNDTLITEYILDKFQFLDISFFLGSDTVDRFPCNKKTFVSFTKYFKDCGYTAVKGYANFSNEEICFIFDDGGWTHKERFIYTCSGFLRISQQGHQAWDNTIFWNNKLLDSSTCPLRYY